VRKLENPGHEFDFTPNHNAGRGAYREYVIRAQQPDVALRTKFGRRTTHRGRFCLFPFFFFSGRQSRAPSTEAYTTQSLAQRSTARPQRAAPQRDIRQSMCGLHEAEVSRTHQYDVLRQKSFSASPWPCAFVATTTPRCDSISPPRILRPVRGVLCSPRYAPTVNRPPGSALEGKPSRNSRGFYNPKKSAHPPPRLVVFGRERSQCASGASKPLADEPRFDPLCPQARNRSQSNKPILFSGFRPRRLQTVGSSMARGVWFRTGPALATRSSLALQSATGSPSCRICFRCFVTPGKAIAGRRVRDAFRDAAAPPTLSLTNRYTSTSSAAGLPRSRLPMYRSDIRLKPHQDFGPRDFTAA